jgi:oxygen-dependent protoporphyrinogen oxidase
VKFAGRAPNDHVLLRAFVGGALQPEMLTFDDEDIVSRVENDLRELLGATGKPLFVDVARWVNSMPQYAVGHLSRVDEIETEASKFPALALAGNAYRGAGVPDCIRSGERAAEILMNS